jgi:hypothetical protein
MLPADGRPESRCLHIFVTISVDELGARVKFAQNIDVGRDLCWCASRIGYWSVSSPSGRI